MQSPDWTPAPQHPEVNTPQGSVLPTLSLLVLKELPKEFLVVLGQDPTTPSQLENRWSHFLQHGLPPDVKAELLTKFRPAETFGLKVSQLNPEAAAIAPLTNVKKDSHFLHAQTFTRSSHYHLTPKQFIQTPNFADTVCFPFNLSR